MAPTLLALGLVLVAPGPARPAGAEEPGDRPAPQRAGVSELRTWLESVPADQRPALKRGLSVGTREQRLDLRRRLRAMTPAERRSELERIAREAPPEAPEARAAREAWQRLRGAERREIQARLVALPSERRQVLRDRLLALPEERRRDALAQLPRVLAMNEAERLDVRERLRRLEGLTPEQRDRLRANLERWRAMSPDERAAARERWRRFQELPPEERERLTQDAS